MADQIPLKRRTSGGDTVALGELEPGDTVGVGFGGTGAPDAATARANLGSAAQADLTAHTGAAAPHSGHLTEVQAGAGVDVDNTDPQRPILSVPGTGGNVTGPASSTNLAISLFDGTSGQLLADSGKSIADVIADVITALESAGRLLPEAASEGDILIRSGGAWIATDTLPF
jgi:hypothetical protein